MRCRTPMGLGLTLSLSASLDLPPTPTFRRPSTHSTYYATRMGGLSGAANAFSQIIYSPDKRNPNLFRIIMFV